MKVLHLSSERSWRGGEQQIAYLIKELEKKKVENIVACRKNSAFEKWCIEHDVPHLPLSFANEFDVMTAWQIRSFCKEMNVDIVHMHSGHAHAMGVWSSVFGNPARLILSRRVDFPVKNNWFSGFKYNYRKIERIVCVSDAIRKITQKALRNPGKCITVYSGIDPGRFSQSKRTHRLHEELGLPRDTRLVANISAIAPHKDYPTFVQTVAYLVAKGFKAHYLVIGTGPDEAKIRAMVEDLRLSSHISFLGFRDDIPEIICDLDMLLVTSRTEGLGTTILDAFATGIPVVATAAGGIPEIVLNHDTGMLVPVANPEKAGKAVIEVFEDDNLRVQLIKNAQIKFNKDFTHTSMADNMLKVYRREI